LAIREKALGTDHPDVAQSLNSLANLYFNQSRYADAEPLYQRSLAIYEKALGPGHPEVANSLNNLAELYRSQGRYTDSLAIIQRTTAQGTAAKGVAFPVLFASQAQKLVSAAQALTDSYDIAQRALSSAAGNAVSMLAARFAAGTSELAQLVRQDQDLTAEAETLDKAVVAFVSKPPAERSTTAEEQVRAQIEAVKAERERLSQIFNQRFPDYVALSKPQPVTLQETQQLLAEDETLLLFDFGAKSYAWIITRTDADWKELTNSADIPRVDTVVSGSAAQQAGFQPGDVVLSIDGKPIESFADIQRTVSMSAGNTLTFAIGRGGEHLTLEAVPTLREVKDAFGNPQRIGVLGISHSGTNLDAQIRALRSGLMEPGQRFDPVLAYQIYQATFGTFDERISAKKRLTIVTNGALTSLPPQLLVTKDPSGKTLKDVDWLVRSHAITVLPSVASLKVLRSGSQDSSAARKLMMAFADPLFSKAAHVRAQQQLAMRSITSFYRGTQADLVAIGDYLPQLPGTRKEVTAIAAELKADPADIKLGSDATETAVKQAKLDQYRIVYFATHGLVSGDLESFGKSKAEPALALTFPEMPSAFDDGLLTASEIAQLKLDADWVVLSACNTAAAEKPGAEALSGLARAFFYAGARSLIVSHWAVSDEATARLMIGTFRASARDPRLSHAEALRQSMLSMIDAAKSDTEADPRLWAPFVVVGEPAKAQ
jgi:CHAT domain-containing protein/tetratricopeptide (TPR) repeat protein